MAITAGKLKITIRGLFNNQRMEVIQWYTAGGAAFLTADAVSVGEAYWNDIKADWRASHVNNSIDRTLSILVSEPGSTGAFGEFSVPTLEQQGTRSISGLGGFLPTFVAAGFRETVATRTTRPGQKRMWGLMENDVGDNSEMLSGYTTLLAALALKFTENIVLGAPVATGVLVPIVCRVDRTTGAVTAQQDITGVVLNPNVTSQVSRKVGRGA